MGPVLAESNQLGTAADAPASRGRFAMAPEDVAWLGAIAGAIVLAAAFIWLAPALADLYPAPAQDVFLQWRVLVRPEPLEDVRSVLALALPVLIAVIVLALGRPRPQRSSLSFWIALAQVAGIGLLVWATLSQSRTGPFLPPDYFPQFLLSVPNLVAGVVLGIVATVLLVRGTRLAAPEPVARAARRVGKLRWLPIVVAAIATAVWLLPAVVTDSTLPQAGNLAAGHVPVQGEDYFAVINGRTPLVDYIAQYANLMPLVLAPLLRAVGPSITSLSIAMCALSAIAMMAVFGALTELTRRAWLGVLLYVPWVALSLFPWNDYGPHREFNGLYYGVFPGRYLGPFVLTWVLAVHLRKRAGHLWLLFGLAGLVVLNNYEFGIAALLGLIAALALTGEERVPPRRRALELVLHAAAGLVAALAVVSMVLLIRTGSLPDLSLLTYYNRLFLQRSFGLEPMPSLGLHWALYATYASALLLAAVRCVRRDADRILTGLLAFSGMFGLVTGMYFVGRSLQFQLVLLFPAWGLALAVLAWAAWQSLSRARGDRRRLRRVLLPSCAALIGFGVMVAAIDRLPSPIAQIDRLRDGGHAVDREPAERFIRSHARPGEKVLIIGESPDHLVAENAGVRNVSPLNGVTSLITPAEANRSLDQLRAEGGTQVFESVSALPAGGLFVFGIPEFATILRQHGYRLAADDPALHLRLWRRAAS